MKSQQAFGELVGPFRRVHLYAAQPGAVAILSEARRELERTGRMGLWLADGWAAHGEVTATAPELLADQARDGDALMLGPQTEFARTRSVIRMCRGWRMPSIFVMDAWQNYDRHFLSEEGATLPDTIVVPDHLAETILRQELAGIALDGTCIVIAGHWAIEAAVARVGEMDPVAVQAFRDSLCSPQRRLVALLLDPSRRPGEIDIGYDAISVLAALPDWLRRRTPVPMIAIKPHPREDRHGLERTLAGWGGIEYRLFDGSLEMLIAAADEVWGCTTSALVMSLACGKPIVSLQPGRIAEGVRRSNPHIEPFVIDDLAK